MSALADYALTVLGGKLVAYWPLDEASGDALDLSGNGNDATVANAAARAAPALDVGGDGSIELDGATTLITVPDAAAIQDIWSNGGASVFFITNLDSDGEGDFGRILDKPSWFIAVRSQVGSNYRQRFRPKFSGGNGSWETDINLPTNTIIPACWDYDADSVDNDPILYIHDGSAFTIRTVGDGLTEIQTPSGTILSDIGNDLQLGNRADGGRTLDGHEDEVMIFKPRLTEAEAATLIELARQTVLVVRSASVAAVQTEAVAPGSLQAAAATLEGVQAESVAASAVQSVSPTADGAQSLVAAAGAVQSATPAAGGVQGASVASGAVQAASLSADSVEAAAPSADGVQDVVVAAGAIQGRSVTVNA